MNKKSQTRFLKFAGSLGGRASLTFLTVAVLGLLALQNAGAQSALPFYEPFPGTYVNGEYLGSTNGVSGSTSGGTSGAVWNIGNSLSSSCARVQTYAALQYPGLTNIDAIAQSDGLASYPKDTSSVKNRAAQLVIPTNTTIYASCLLNMQQITNVTTAAFFGLSPTTTGTSVSQNGAVVYISPAGQLLVSKNSTTPDTNTTYSLTTSNTYLLVLRYQYNSGSPDQVDLWLNPTSLGNDSTVPPPTITTTNNANVTTFGSVAYFQAGGPTLFYLDEIRVATNWSGVTPTTPAPGNLHSVTGGGSSCAGATFNVGVSGSDSGVDYLLYTNGVFTGQSVPGTGAAVSFGLQSASALYTVLATNETTANVGWMSGSTTVFVVPAPNLTAQPIPAVVATNGLAAFTISSVGIGLSYQWYRNGAPLSDGGHYSGSHTTNLVINPATTADAATAANGYYIKVSNPCGDSLVSVTNGLTLDAPGNRVWYGDGVSNLWDVATSSNWDFSNILGYPVDVFNFGDNVTFDDTAAYTTVVLNNPNQSPSSITVNGSQSFSFGGSGALAGNGSILMNSLGTLTINTPNTMTGGITISNGTVAFAGPGSLGSGPIILAGGELASPGTGLVTVTNSINITGTNTQTFANSIIGVNSPGGQPLVITSRLNGVAGSLTLQNIGTKSGASGNIEFTATNFTFNLPVDLNIGPGALQLGGFNTAGSQIWNGVISDTGGVWRNAVGGTTILNSTNTYSGGTRLSNGSLGVGSDSVSSFPPTVDYGPLGTGTLTIDTTGGTLQLFASGGAHVVGNSVNYTSNTISPAFIIGGSNRLTLSGGFDLSGTNRVIQTDNTGATILSGDITDDGLVNGFTKTGNGTLYLDGVSDFTGNLTNSAGILAGSGTVSGPVVIRSGATLGAGDAGTIPGTFTLNAGLTLNGNVAIRVNKSLAQSNDFVSVTGTLANAGTGTLTVSNVGPALAVGDSFTLFSQPVVNGQALTVTGGGVNWTNKLAVDGSIQVFSTSANYPTNISVSVTGGILTISWPATHLGWNLQSQTNSLSTGLGTNWTTIPGSSAVTSTNIPINPANPTVFYRLSKP